MDQPGPSQPQPSASTSDNPVIAIGQKVKAALTSDQRPSVRILRGSTYQGAAANTEQDDVPSSEEQELAERYAAQAKAYSSRTFGDRVRGVFGGGPQPPPQQHIDSEQQRSDEYDADTVDLMDVIDPEVATLSTLTNVQNSLFIPSLGRFVNRRPTYTLTERPGEERTIQKLRSILHLPKPEDGEGEKPSEIDFDAVSQPPLARSSTITSTINDSHYAVLPHGESLQGWTPEEKAELDDLVRHMLHSRRAKFKRKMKGFGQYVRHPLGLFVTVYATLITLFGAAWVLFLIGWISIGSKRDYVVNVVDNVLVALFAIMGDGLAPFRAVDTYHMAFIAHYHRKTWRKRARLGLPELADNNDLPEQRKAEIQPAAVDVESLIARKIPSGLARVVAPRIPRRIARRIVTRAGTSDPSYEYSVLSEKQQARLEYHEKRFSKSHTFYKPHETETHYAFPLRLLIAIVVLLDFHSALQITLGACTWGIPYQTRPFALTTVVLCCSITCNIMGGVLILIGDKRTRKTEVIERMMRQELTSEAMEQMQTRWMKEAEAQGELDKSVRKRFKEEKEEKENKEILNAWKRVPMLPKTLLGRGQDHREPSLPQSAKSAGARTPSDSGVSTPKDSRSKSRQVLAPVQENPQSARASAPAPPLPTRPPPVLARRQSPESTGHRILRMIRRADMDRS